MSSKTGQETAKVNACQIDNASSRWEKAIPYSLFPISHFQKTKNKTNKQKTLTNGTESSVILMTASLLRNVGVQSGGKTSSPYHQTIWSRHCPFPFWIKMWKGCKLLVMLNALYWTISDLESIKHTHSGEPFYWFWFIRFYTIEFHVLH